MTDFAGKSVIVTGAVSGTGAATVRRLVADGASAVGVDIHGGEPSFGLRTATGTIRSAPGFSPVVKRI